MKLIKKYAVLIIPPIILVIASGYWRHSEGSKVEWGAFDFLVLGACAVIFVFAVYMNERNNKDK